MNDDRSAPDGRPPEPIIARYLYRVVTAPEYDDDSKEWKITAIPVRIEWGLVSGSGDWVGGGQRGEGGVYKRWREEIEEHVSTVWLADWWRKPNSQEAFTAPPHVCVGERYYVDRIDRNLHLSGYRDRTVGFLLQEDHQGRGVETDIYCGIWNIDDQEWEYPCTPIKIMIHWRYGTPEPAAGATGLGKWQESTDNGAILEVTVGDCESIPVTCT